MSDVIHLNPTGISGEGGSPNQKIVEVAARRSAQNPEGLTECGLKLSDIQSVHVGQLSKVTCKACRQAAGV
jgi:hypothetical protein